MRLIVLALVAASALAEEPPAAEETAARLVSPRAEERARAQALVEDAPDPDYGRRVLAAVAAHAHDRGAWIASLKERRAKTGGAERARVERMLAVLRGERVGVDLYFVSVPPALAKRILGERDAVAFAEEETGWRAWWRQIADDRDAATLYWGSVSTFDREATTVRAQASVSYVAGFEIGPDDRTVADPVVATIETFGQARVTPVVSLDRRHLTLDVGLEARDVVRPIAVEKRDLGPRQVEVARPQPVTAARRLTATLRPGGGAAWRLPGGKGRPILVLARAVLGPPAAMRPPPPAAARDGR